MSLEWKPALPVSFLNPEAMVRGNIYPGIFSEQPPMEVRERLPDDEGRDCIVVELENIMGRATMEVAPAFGIERDVDETMRLMMHPGDARRLCSGLITALAMAGDPVGKRLYEMMTTAMNQAREERDRNDRG